MKQLKKVQLQDAKELTPNQMKNITGGGPTSGSFCGNFSEAKCSSTSVCLAQGDRGHCEWSSNECKCVKS